jgi:hypothetical protein
LVYVIGKQQPLEFALETEDKKQRSLVLLPILLPFLGFVPQSFVGDGRKKGGKLIHRDASRLLIGRGERI